MTGLHRTVFLFGFVVIWATGCQHARGAIQVRNYVDDQLESSGALANRAPELQRSLERFCRDRPMVDSGERYSNASERRRVRGAASSLEKQLREASTRLERSSLVSTPSFEAAVLLGCGKTDAFAIRVGSKFTVFFDVHTLIEQGRGGDMPRPFVFHELMHGVHFSTNPDFAASQREGPRERLLKYLLSEGVATYFSAKLSEADERTVFSGDILTAAEHEEWKQRAVRNEKTIGRRLEAFLDDPSTHPKLKSELFVVREMKNLVEKRHGYWYGYEIARRLFEKGGASIDFSYAAGKEAVLEYFGISEQARSSGDRARHPRADRSL